MRSWHKFLQSHLDSFTVTLDSQPSTGICPSTRINPSGSFVWTKELSSVNRDSSISTALSGPTSFHPSTGIIPSIQLTVTNQLSAIYRDFSSGPKALVGLPGFCKNSCQRVPQSATKLNRRAVSLNVRLISM